MDSRSDFPLLEDPKELARLEGWTEGVYTDLMAVEARSMTGKAFDAKYLATRAVLVLDVTGFTVTTIHGGAISSFLRILDAHKIAAPLFEEHGARVVRAFADDLTAVFDDADAALHAALGIQRRVGALSPEKHAHPPECCIGIGFGDVYEIGPNRAMGDEMNQASKLGEDIARGGEILLTEGAFQALSARSDVRFEAQTGDDLLFPYHRVTHPG